MATKMISPTQSGHDGGYGGRPLPGSSPVSAYPSSSSSSGSVNSSDCPDPLEPLRRHWAQLTKEVAYYISLQTDNVRLQLRTVLLYAVLGTGAAVTGLTAAIVAVVLLLRGITDCVAILLDGRVWASELIVGTAVLVFGVAAAMGGIRWFIKTSRQRTIEKYEPRRHECVTTHSNPV